MRIPAVSTLLRLSASGLLGAVAWGCQATEQAQTASVQAALVSVDTLQESDSLFVARISRAYIGADRRTYVSDQVQPRVVVFDSSGRPIQVLGRAGEGPGEFRGPAAITPWGRDSLVVTDLPNRNISVFRRSDGEFLWRAVAPGSVSSVAPLGSQLVVASFAPQPYYSVAVIPPGAREFVRALPVDDSLLTQQLGAAAFARSVVAENKGRLAVGLLWSNVVSVYDSALTPMLSFAVPHRTRRPIPPNLDEALKPVVNSPGRLTLMALLSSIEWLDNGLLVLIHKDWYAPEGGIADQQRVAIEATMRAFATVIDIDDARACPDVELPAEWAENPYFFNDGETLAGLGHVIGETSRPTLELRRYNMRLDECAWVPLVVAPSARLTTAQ